MSTRLTRRELESKIHDLNQLTGNPVNYVTEHNKPAIGHFFLDHSYHDYNLSRIADEYGGISIIQPGMSAMETNLFLNGYILGAKLAGDHTNKQENGNSKKEDKENVDSGTERPTIFNKRKRGSTVSARS